MNNSSMVDIFFGMIFTLIVLLAQSNPQSQTISKNSTTAVVLSFRGGTVDVDLLKRHDNFISVSSSGRQIVYIKGRDSAVPSNLRSGEAFAVFLPLSLDEKRSYQFKIVLPIKPGNDNDINVLREYVSLVECGKIGRPDSVPTFAKLATEQLRDLIHNVITSRDNDAWKQGLEGIGALKDESGTKGIAPNRIDEFALSLLFRKAFANGDGKYASERALFVQELLACFYYLGQLQPGGQDPTPGLAIPPKKTEERMRGLENAAKLYLWSEDPRLGSSAVMRWPYFPTGKTDDYELRVDGIEFDVKKTAELITDAANRIKGVWPSNPRNSIEEQKLTEFAYANGILFFKTLLNLVEPKCQVVIMDPSDPDRGMSIELKRSIEKDHVVWEFTIPSSKNERQNGSPRK